MCTLLPHEHCAPRTPPNTRDNVMQWRTTALALITHRLRNGYAILQWGYATLRYGYASVMTSLVLRNTSLGLRNTLLGLRNTSLGLRECYDLSSVTQYFTRIT